jgi:PAS domain S-box-containing protein
VTVPRDGSFEADADLQRAQLAAIVVSSDDAIVGKTLDGFITSWNRGAERMFGYTEKEAIGQHITIIIPLDRRSEEDEVLARIRRGDKIDHFETVRQRKDGSLVDISLTVSPIRTHDGRIVGASKVARDITERRLASEALALSQRRYRRIFDLAGVSIWEEDFSAVKTALDDLKAAGVTDFRSYFSDRPAEIDRFVGLVRVVDVNEDTLRMFGTSDKTVLLQSLGTIFDPETRDVFAQELVAFAEGRTRFEAEALVRKLSGEPLHVVVSITFPPPGEPADSVLVSLTDITPRKKAEQDQRDSEALFHEMADTAPAMLWVCDASGAWTFVSRQWFELTGQTFGAALGLGWLDAVHPDDRESAHDVFVEAIGRRRPFQFECRLKQAGGENRWTINAAQPLLAANGDFLGYVGSVIDITERRLAEEEVIDEVHIRETLSRVGAALASELDPDTLVQSAIDAATELTSAQIGAFFYNVVDVTGETEQRHVVSGAPKASLADFPASRAAALLGIDFRSDKVVRVDDALVDPRTGVTDSLTSLVVDHLRSPTSLVVDHLLVRSCLAVPVVSRTGEVWGGLFFGHARPDMFLPKHEQLASGIASWAALALDNARLYREAQEANRVKDEFMATLSHELRTPLNAMLGWAHMLRSGTLPEETERRALDTLERNVRAQAQLVDDLLDVSRIAAGKLQIKSDDVDLAGVVMSAAETVRPAALAKGITLRVTVDQDRQVIVTGDADRLRQILWNLLTNAVKFTPKGGQVQIELRHTDLSASVVVRDTGQGIRADFLRHVFERFRQADSTASRRHGGLGLGLAIVRHLTEAHGGSVAAESDGEGCGATFTVYLPVRAIRGRVDYASGMRDARSTALSELRILLVDDEPDTREVMRVILEIEGADVTTAASAGEALSILARRRVDVLLADIGMPGQDGYSLMEAVRALPRDGAGSTPAVAVTAYVSTRDRERAFEAGYGWHVAKPVDPEQLVAVVSTAARSRSATQV